MSALGLGKPAPDFSLPDQHGKPFSLSEARGKTVVLYFYPKDNTAGCTAEACSFRDSYQDFTDAGALVVGVSSDDAESHQGFAAKHRLPFTLLTDKGGAVAKLYGVSSMLGGLLKGRVTYVIDPKGIIRHHVDAMILVNNHVHESLKVVKQLVGRP